MAVVHSITVLEHPRARDNDSITLEMFNVEGSLHHHPTMLVIGVRGKTFLIQELMRRHQATGRIGAVVVFTDKNGLSQYTDVVPRAMLYDGIDDTCFCEVVQLSNKYTLHRWFECLVQHHHRMHVSQHHHRIHRMNARQTLLCTHTSTISA